jgi:hypothetical protein
VEGLSEQKRSESVGGIEECTLQVASGKSIGKERQTHLVDQILTPRPDTNPPTAIFLPLVPLRLQVLEPTDESSKTSRRAVLKTLLERGGLDSEGFGGFAGDLRGRGESVGKEEQERGVGRTTGLSSTLIDEKGKVAALGLPARRLRVVCVSQRDRK